MESNDHPLHAVNESVLRLIKVKKQPLKSHRTVLARQQTQRLMLPTSEQSLKWSSSLPKEKVVTEESPRAIRVSMGEYLQSPKVRYLMSNNLECPSLEEITGRVQHFIWEKRREIDERAKEELRRKRNNTLNSTAFATVQATEKTVKTMTSIKRATRNDKFRIKRRKQNDPKSTFDVFHRQDQLIVDKQSKPILVSSDWNTYRQYLVSQEYSPHISYEQKRQQIDSGLKSFLTEEIKKSSMLQKYARIRIPMNHRKLINAREINDIKILE